MERVQFGTMRTSRRQTGRRTVAHPLPNRLHQSSETTNRPDSGVFAQLPMLYVEFEDEANDNSTISTERAQELWAEGNSASTAEPSRHALRTYRIATLVRRLRDSLQSEAVVSDDDAALVPITFEGEAVGAGVMVLYYADDFASSSADGQIHYVRAQTRQILDALSIPYTVVQHEKPSS